MRMHLSVAVVTLSLALPVGSAQAQSSGATYVGDLPSLGRASVESAQLALPAATPAKAPTAGATWARSSNVAPVAHISPIAKQKPAPPAKQERKGLFSSLKSSWPFGRKEKTPASDPFQAAKRQANAAIVARSQTASPQGVQAIPAQMPNTQGAGVTTTAYSKQFSNTRKGGISKGQHTGNKSIYDALFGKNDQQKTSAGPTKQAKPIGKPSPTLQAQSQTRGRLRPGSRTTTTTPQAQGPNSKSSSMRLAANPFARKPSKSTQSKLGGTPRKFKEPAGSALIVSDMTPSKPRPTAPKPLPLNDKIAKPNPFAVVKDEAEPVLPINPSDESLAITSKTPKPIVKEVTPTPIAPLPWKPKPTEIVRKQSDAKQTKPLELKPSAPSERSCSLLAEAHQLATTADDVDSFTAVLKRCRYVLAIDQSPTAQTYASQLAGWAMAKRGELFEKSSRLDEAKVDYLDAVQFDANCWRAEHALGVLSIREGELESARMRFQQTLQLNPEYAPAYANLATLSVQTGAYEQALVDYAEAIAIDPDLALAHIGRGRVCHILGKLDEALRHLDAAEVLDPTDASVAAARGDVLTDLGHYGHAVQAYQQAIRLDPQSTIAHRNLAWLQATCPQPAFRSGKAALANALRAEELAGQSDDLTLDTKAAALASLGRFDEAAAIQLEAIALAPEAEGPAYRERLALYEQGQAYTATSAPVQQASHVD